MSDFSAAIDAINTLAASRDAAEFYRKQFEEGEDSITFLFPVNHIMHMINISKADDNLLIYKLFNIHTNTETGVPITSAKEVPQAGGYRKKHSSNRRKTNRRRRSNKRRTTRRHK